MSVVFANVAARRPLLRLVILTQTTLAVTTFASSSTVQHFDHSLILLAAIYVLAEIRGCLNTVQYGILMNEMFVGTPNHSYAVGVLSAAATLAGITFGALIGFEFYQLGTVHLLYVVAGLELLAIIPVTLLPRIDTVCGDDEFESDTTQTKPNVDSYVPLKFTRRLATAARSPYVRGFATLIAITVVVSTLIEFQWKSSVAQSFATDEDRMTRFFGFYYSATNLVTGLIQILVTGKLLHHFGTRTALLVFPVTLLASTLGVVFASFDRVVLSVITLAKGCDVFKRSVNDPAIVMLYAPLQNGPRRQAITFVAGIVKPSAEAVAAILIMSLASVVSTWAFSCVALALTCVWIVAVTRRGINNRTTETASTSDVTN
ncbi:MAG: Npt1/Npt2 family nucleotide transporter [Planctomycetota bacterium]|nr:Npt1/Npt2 family nucleotide transporter [Planctomycetota bacterium]